MDTNTATKMTVKKYPAVWRLSAGAWCVEIVRSVAVDAVLRQGRQATFTMTTRQVTVSMETGRGTHVTVRTEVVGRRVETTLGTFAIDCNGNVI